MSGLNVVSGLLGMLALSSTPLLNDWKHLVAWAGKLYAKHQKDRGSPARNKCRQPAGGTAKRQRTVGGLVKRLHQVGWVILGKLFIPPTQ